MSALELELTRLAKLSDQWQDSHLGEPPFIQQAFGGSDKGPMETKREQQGRRDPTTHT